VGIFAQAPTRSAWKNILKKGLVSVDNQLASTATLIHGGELIELRDQETTTPVKQFDLTLKVLYEDEYLAAIHKPAGIEVSGNKFKTITNALAQNLSFSSLPDAAIPQPVHRLDFPTTGVLLVGKTKSAIRELNRLFEEKQVVKTYLAVVIGKMSVSEEINLPVDEKPASSGYEVLDAVPSSRFGWLSLLKLTPSTGRRHQLRKHLSGIGHPILGDSEYAFHGLELKGKGLYLHASVIQFIHPETNVSMNIESALPVRFTKIFPNFKSGS
jgi:23S rRNA pseudouridine1911/1915/1917 synthase